MVQKNQTILAGYVRKKVSGEGNLQKCGPPIKNIALLQTLLFNMVPPLIPDWSSHFFAADAKNEEDLCNIE